MYIEYITPQPVADTRFTNYHSNGGEFRPTWLIRTSDWQKVPGIEATNGYHTVSYCWEQSGEKFEKGDGEYELNDGPHHRIRKTVLEKHVTRRSTRYRRRTFTTYVTYNGILQQICKDFGIDYLWYDKICINQMDKAEKHREIKQMHLIYSNAQYTVAVVPEIYNDNPRKLKDESYFVPGYTQAKEDALRSATNSLWWGRCWTLEEVMMSTRMVIIGRNTHVWCLSVGKQGNTIKEDDILSSWMLGFKDKSRRSANGVLHHAHFRTSTKDHDKVFALANIFHGVISIDIDYHSDVKSVMHNFYYGLGSRDLSVMCFGSVLDLDGEPAIATEMSSYNLPSWTGVSGIHAKRAVSDIALDKNGRYEVDSALRLHIHCKSYSICPIKLDDAGDFYINSERVSQAGFNMTRVITSMDDFGGDQSAAIDWSLRCMDAATGFFATHYWIPPQGTELCSPVFALSLTEDCDECVILSVLFCISMMETSDSVPVGFKYDYFLPVLKKSADTPTFKAVGIILLKHSPYGESLKCPEEILNDVFNKLSCCNINEFVVE